MQRAKWTRPTAERSPEECSINPKRANSKQGKLSILYEILKDAYGTSESGERTAITIEERTHKTSLENASKPQIRNCESSNLSNLSFII